jgi:RimJ/RimL family protein N-acetyltransferase
MRLPIDGPYFRLRAYRTSDAAAVAELRSDPSTAEWQSWVVPYPMDKAQQMVDSVMALDGPTPGEWWGLVIADLTTDDLIGNLAVHLAEHGHSAEIGYALCVEHRGKGLATAATALLVDALFEWPEMNRLEGSLHPHNVASAMVLERLGFVYEGTSRQSYWVEDVVSDDAHYGMLRQEWSAWNDGAAERPTVVELAEITERNLDDVTGLATHHSQRRFVAPVYRSLAQALIKPLHEGEPVVPWYRAIVADDAVVGFVMLSDVSPTEPHPYVWRLLIDRAHQRRGIASKVLELLVADRIAKGDTKLVLSYMPGPGSPEAFYRKHGFIPTGKVDDGEIEAILDLDQIRSSSY